MTTQLYYAPGACSFVPHVLMEASGAPFEPVWVKIHKGEQREPAYLALNPRGQVPVLVDGDAVVTQILAIVLYIDARFPQAGFLPPAGMARTRALELLAWMNNTVHPTFTHVFMPHKFAQSPEAQADVKATGKAGYRALMAELQDIVGKAGGGWLGGERFGAADAYALTLARWGGFAGIDPATLPVLWKHVEKVAAEPFVRRVIEREKLQLNVYKPD